MRATWRSHVLPALLIVFAALVIFAPLALHPTDLLVGTQHRGTNDLTSAFLAFHSFPRIVAARTGEWPWWNPWFLGGAPCFGNPQAALLYPPNWLYLVIDPQWIISWVLVAHHVWGGWGAYLLARRWQCRWESACLAGLVYLGAPFLVAQTGEGHYNQICVVSWIPWAWLAWERLAARQRGGAAALIATLVMSFAAGHVQEWYYLLLLLGALTGWELIARWRRRERPAAMRLARDSLLAVVLAIGVIAVELIPTYLYTTQTVRGGKISAAAAGEISLGLPSVRQLAQPLAWGGPDAYQGPGRFYWETLFHFGIVPLLLAATALVLRRRDSHLWKLAAIAALTTAFAFGDGSPVFALAHRFVPGVGLFRAPSRSLFFASLAVALLAGLALDRLLLRRSTASPETDPARPREGWRLRQFAALIVFVLTTLELARHGQQILRTIPRANIRDPQTLVAQLEGAAAGSRVLADQAYLSDREAWQGAVVKLQGYDPVPFVRQVALLDAIAQTPDLGLLLMGFAPLDLSTLRAPPLHAAGVRWAVVAPQATPVPEYWRLVARGTMPEEFTPRGAAPATREYELYENSAALPRAFLVGRVLEADARESVQLLVDFDPRREVILTQDVLPAADAKQRTEFREARIVSAGAASLVVEAELDRPGYLVVQDTWAPGWQATVDGEPVQIQPANVAARAVPLTAGVHRVEFTYSPPGLALGAVVSLISLVLVGVQSRSSWQ